MTKAEWLESLDGPRMLLAVPSGKSTPRKSLLRSCGCLRCHVELHGDSYSFGPECFAPASNKADWLTGAEAAADANPSILEAYLMSMAGQKAHWWVPPEALARVVRDLFPYPSAPDPFPDGWLTTTVIELAETIDTQGSFEVMPILADALEEAGCADEDVLRHCRHESRHFRGCWVLDSLLGRRAGRNLHRASSEIKPEEVRDLLRPSEVFPGGYFLVGDVESGYVISAWDREGRRCTLCCADDPLYFAMTEHLLANGALRFSSSWEAETAHARDSAGGGR